MVTKAGAKLLDFGLAKLRALEAETGAALSSLHTATAAKPPTSVGDAAKSLTSRRYASAFSTASCQEQP